MCGIVAVVRDRGVRNPPDLGALLDDGMRQLGAAFDGSLGSGSR